MTADKTATVVEALAAVMGDRLTLTENGCYEWTGPRTDRGYGQIMQGGVRYLAHRFAYQMIRGPIPDGLVLDHLCRNTSCVNPAHLEAVTDRENILRGVGVAAQNAVKTHCKNGHEFTAQNTYLRLTGGRMCRTCAIAAKRRWRARQSVGAA